MVAKSIQNTITYLISFIKMHQILRVWFYTDIQFYARNYSGYIYACNYSVCLYGKKNLA